jgi:hypothetical protein
MAPALKVTYFHGNFGRAQPVRLALYMNGKSRSKGANCRCRGLQSSVESAKYQLPIEPCFVPSHSVSSYVKSHLCISRSALFVVAELLTETTRIMLSLLFAAVTLRSLRRADIPFEDVRHTMPEFHEAKKDDKGDLYPMGQVRSCRSRPFQLL